jgi:recombinational DNA repair protein (RecF pathway)
LNLLLPESQPYKRLFVSLNNLLTDLDKENWIPLYISWELTLLKELGFDPFLEQFILDNDDESEKYKIIEIDNIKYQVPIFLLLRKKNIDLDNKQISMALSFTRNILTNKFFFPNNLMFPKSRIMLENYFN